MLSSVLFVFVSKDWNEIKLLRKGEYMVMKKAGSEY